MFSSPQAIVQSRAYADFNRDPTATFRTLTVTLAPRRPLFLQLIRRDAFRVLDGCIVIYQELDGKRRQTLDILGPGRGFSYAMASLQNFEAEAIEPTRVERLDAGSDSASSELQRAIYLSLLRMQAHATLLGRKTAAERVASVLLDLAQQFSSGNRARDRERPTFTIHLTRAEIADYLGLTLETVSRNLSRLKREKLISFVRPEIVTILDRTALEELATGRRASRPDCSNTSLTTDLVMV